MRSSRSWPRATTILGATFGKPRAKTSCARSMRPDRRSPRSSQQVMLFQRRHTSFSFRLYLTLGAQRPKKSRIAKTGACRPSLGVAFSRTLPEYKALMITDAAAVPDTSDEAHPEKRSKISEEYRSVGVVSLAHFVNHFHNLVLPPLFPFLKAQLGIGFV